MAIINETLNLIHERRSIRKFTAEPLTDDQISTLTEAALASPSAMNSQPWRFHFISNLEIIAQINQAAQAKFTESGNQIVLDRLAERQATSIFYGAPLVVVVSIPNNNKSGYALIDVGIAVENIILAAQSLGLGSCVIGMADAAFSGFPRMTIGRAIQMPEDHDFAISLAVGHPAMTKSAHPVLPGHLFRID
jgi:nitroreductase